MYPPLLMISEEVHMTPEENPVRLILYIDTSGSFYSYWLWKLGSERGFGKLTLYLFEVRYDYVLCYGYKAGFIYTMFYVLYNVLCGHHGVVTISKMLCICYCRVSIVLTVHTDWLYFHLHKVRIALLHFPHTNSDVWCDLGQLKSCNRLKGVSLPTDDLIRQVTWWLHMFLTKKILLYTRHLFMSHNSEVANLPFREKCVMIKLS